MTYFSNGPFTKFFITTRVPQKISPLVIKKFHTQKGDFSQPLVKNCFHIPHSRDLKVLIKTVRWLSQEVGGETVKKGKSPLKTREIEAQQNTFEMGCDIKIIPKNVSTNNPLRSLTVIPLARSKCVRISLSVLVFLGEARRRKFTRNKKVYFACQRLF